MSAESIKVCMRFRKELGIPVNIQSNQCNRTLSLLLGNFTKKKAE